MTDLLSTRKAAEVYGCRPNSLRSIMHKHGVHATIVRVLHKPFALWNPADVLRVRALTVEAKRQRRERLPRVNRHPAMRAYKRHQQLEAFRQRILARAEQRRANAA
jgi:hypothetical protein